MITINLKSSEELQTALSAIQSGGSLNKKDIKDKKVANDLKNIKKLTGDVQNDNKDDDEIDFEKLMGGMMDSGIGNIAKEVAESMNIEDMLEGIDENSNPMEVMGKLMNPEKMGSIFKNIDSVMKNKMENGEITEDTLKEEAMGMMGKMDKNPLFNGMMNEMNNTQGQEEKGQGKEDNVKEKEEKHGENKDKLKKKINEKKEKRTNRTN